MRAIENRKRVNDSGGYDWTMLREVNGKRCGVAERLTRQDLEDRRICAVRLRLARRQLRQYMARMLAAGVAPN